MHKHLKTLARRLDRCCGLAAAPALYAHDS